MKKQVRIVFGILIIILVCFFAKRGLLDFSVKNEISSEDLEQYSKYYYFNQLTDNQKKIYVAMDKKIQNLEHIIKLGTDDEVIKDAEKALNAIYNDREDYYFLENRYSVINTNLVLANVHSIKLSYTVEDMAEKEKLDKRLEEATDKFLKDLITQDMTEFEKELAIHDKLVKQVKYFKHEKIEDIPAIKHTLYGALVEKEAVCDGITRAFKHLLKQVGIESMMVTGTLDNVAHAWNIVKIEDKYYYVDATSDSVELENKKTVVHKYFNITEDALTKTHNLDETFKLPKCTDTKYNYYIYNDYFVKYGDSLRGKLGRIMYYQENSDILEFEVDESYDSQEVVDMLYMLDFNNWNSSNITSVKYHSMENVYVFNQK